MRVQTKHAIQGGVLLLVAVLAHGLPGWWSDWQAKLQAGREFQQAHYSVRVYCKNCREGTLVWQDKGKQIEGMYSKCGACEMQLRVGLKGDNAWSAAWGYVVVEKESESDDE